MSFSAPIPPLPFPLEETLFLSDLDGTLLNTFAQLNALTAKNLQRLLDHERLSLSFATAREYISLRKVLPTTQFPLPLVIANGAFLFDSIQEKPIMTSHFTEEEVTVLRTQTEAAKLDPLVYAYQGSEESLRWIQHPNSMSEGARYYLEHQPQTERLQPLNPGQEERLWEGEIFCLNLMDQKPVLEPLYESLRTTDLFYIIFHQELYRPEWWLSIYPKTVNKGKMARCLLEQLGKRYLVVFGDQTNDIPLFDAADASYAVANAHPFLRERATAVLPWSNNEDAVVRFLLHALGEDADGEGETATVYGH